MIKNKSIIILLLFIFSLNIYGQINFPLDYSRLSLKDTAGTVQFQEVKLSTQPGAPGLPCDSITFLLPPDIDPETIDITLVNTTETTLQNSYYVAPAPPDFIGDKEIWPQGKHIENGKDIDIYLNDSFYPASYLVSSKFGRLHQYNLLEVTIYPYLYNPVNSILKKLNNCDFVISYENKIVDQTNQFKNSDNNIKNYIIDIAVNAENIIGLYENTDSLLSITSDPRETSAKAVPANSNFIIITTEKIATASTQLSSYIASKENRGFTVGVATETDWGGGIGDIAAENIRSWLVNNYTTSGIEYVLFIGNPDPEEGDVPMKMCWPVQLEIIHGDDTPADTPTDFYYAELSGNWDADNDGYYGEYEDDFLITGGPDKYAELSVGRIPYYGNITDLDHILAKMVTYENETEATSSWRTKVLLPMAKIGNFNPGYDVGEIVKDLIFEPHGWQYHRIYEGHYGIGPETRPCDVDIATDVWKNGTFGYVLIQDHGNIPHTGTMGVITNKKVPELDDTHPAINFQISCATAYPEVDSNLAYNLLKNGTVATIAATRNAFSSGAKRAFESSNAAGLAYYFAEGIVKGKLYTGDALKTARSTFNLLDAHSWLTCIEYNIYGCPAIGIYTSNGKYFILRNIKNQKIYSGESFRIINLDEYVFNTKYTDEDISWTTSTSGDLTVIIDANRIAKVTPPSAGWTGTELVTLTATDPDGSVKSISFTCESVNANYIYISDMDWVSASFGTDINKDLSVDGNILTVAGSSYDKGIGTHAVSEIIYDINGTYQWFSSDLGIDDEASLGCVRFEIFGDNISLFRSQLLRSGMVDHCEVYIGNSNQIKLVVSDGRDNTVSDHADWAGAKFISGQIENTHLITVTVDEYEGNYSSYPYWEFSKVYQPGEIISFYNHDFRARVETTGEKPDIDDRTGSWEDLGACGIPQPGLSIFAVPYTTIQVLEGNTQTVAFMANDYSVGLDPSTNNSVYEVLNVIVDGIKVLPVEKDAVTFQNVTGDHNIQVEILKKVKKTVTIKIEGINLDQALVSGDGQKFTFVDNGLYATSTNNFRFNSWIVETGNAYLHKPNDQACIYNLFSDTTFVVKFDPPANTVLITTKVKEAQPGIIEQLPMNCTFMNNPAYIFPVGGDTFGDSLLPGDYVFADSDGPEYAVKVMEPFYNGYKLEHDYSSANFTDVPCSKYSLGFEDRGTIDPLGYTAYDFNTDQSITVIPDPGFHLENIILDGISLGRRLDIHLFNIGEGHNIEAEFGEGELAVYTITVSTSENGTTNLSGNTRFHEGENVTIQFQPDPGYLTDEVLINGVSGAPADEIILENISENYTVSAVFVPDVLLGDANSNGVVDIIDALLVAQYYVGLNPPGFNPDVADANCNGVVDIIDALIIARYYVHLEDQLC